MTPAASLPSCASVSASILGAKQHVFRVQSHLRADCARDLFVVAGEYLNADPVFGERLYGGLGRVLRRVEECEEAYQHHVPFVCGRKLPRRRRIGLLSHGNYAHPLLVHCVGSACDQRAHLVRERKHAAAALGEGAALEHLLHRALGHQLSLTRSVPDYHAHAAALKVKRYLVDLGVPLRQVAGSQLLLSGYHGYVYEVLQPRLEIAVQESVAQHALIFRAVDVQVVLQHDPVLSQSARLVCAEYVHGAQVLYGI